MERWHTGVGGIARCANAGEDIEATRVLGQGQAPFRFRPVRFPPLRTRQLRQRRLWRVSRMSASRVVMVR